MHDGRILEDKKIELKIEKQEDEDVEVGLARNTSKTDPNLSSGTISYKSISIWNRFRIGIRNTFNIFTKFALLFCVFLFIVTAIMTQYSAFKKQEHLAEKGRSNYFFKDRSENRIVVKKKDKTNFTKEEYEELKQMSNIKEVVENDLLLDGVISLTNEHNLYIYGTVKKTNQFQGELDIGRLPENEEEIIVEGSKSDYYLGTMHKELLESQLYVMDQYSGMHDKTSLLKVVAIKYKEDSGFMYTEPTIYVSNTVLEKMKFQINRGYSYLRVLFLDNYYESMPGNFYVVANENVPLGSCYVSGDLNNYATSGSVLKKPIQIEVENLYYKDTRSLTIEKTYTKNNMKSLLKLTDYDMYNGSIFINPEDYNNLFNKELYQSSVFVNNMNEIYQTVETLEDMGYETLVMKDTLQEDGIAQIMKILRTVVTIALVFTISFISYFIVNIILKSRNVYFSTLRMLGANKKVLKQLIVIELLIIANLAFWTFTGAVLLQNYNILDIGFIKTVAEYLKFGDYVILYMIVTGMSYFISLKYAKKLFKSATMQTLKEEV